MGRKSKEQKAFEEKKEAMLEEAREKGIADNFLYDTTFRRYEIQVGILAELEKKIEESDTIVTKEYVKGRENAYVHPAITEYNKTATAANQTATTLTKLIEALSKASTEDDGFLDFLAAKE